jgi:hypothetical protein
MTNWNLKSPGICTPVSGSVNATVINTKTAWSQLHAGVPYTGFLDLETNVNNNSCGWLFDIGIGASGSEVVIANNMYFAPGTNYKYGISFRLPVLIPKGERLAFRAQSSNSLYGGFYVRGSFSPIGFMGNGRVYSLSKTYGANTADSGGTNITTNNGWYTFAASADYDFKAIMLFWGESGAQASHSKFHFDVGTGATPVEVISNLLGGAHTTNDIINPGFCSFRSVTLPKGDAIKIQATHTDAVATIDVVALCFA